MLRNIVSAAFSSLQLLQPSQKILQGKSQKAKVQKHDSLLQIYVYKFVNNKIKL